MKKYLFSLVLMVLLAAEIIFFCVRYYYGPHQKIKELTYAHQTMERSVSQLKEENRALEKEIADFKRYPYYKEKIIRDQLQMIKPDEVIYKTS